MSSRPPIDGSTSRPRPIEVAIVGNDALVAALPARPVQLSHAIHAMGYDFVVPVSWGEEIVAEHAVRALNARRLAPAIFCACARVRERLLASGSELATHILAFISPAVAAARYVRALQPTARMRVTFIGSCDTGGDAAINATLTAEDLLKRLAERGISPVRQPAVFDSVIPPDRRRFYSLPGGCPAPNALTSHAPQWHQVTVGDEDFAASLAELVLDGERVVIDLTPQLGCTCCAALGSAAREEREGDAPTLLSELEPPRSSAPVLDHDIEVSVEAPPLRRGRSLPAASVAHDLLTRELAHGVDLRTQGAAPPPAPRETQHREQQVRDRILREGASGAHTEEARELSHGTSAPPPPAPATPPHPTAATSSIHVVEQQSPPAVAHEPTPHAGSRREAEAGETRRDDGGTERPRDVSASEREREVQRRALPADTPPPRRTFGALRLEGGHEGAARRRIAVTPPSVPVMPLRGGAAASLGAGGAAALRVPIALPPHEPATAPEVTPAIGVPAIQPHPSSIDAPRAPVPVLPIASARTEVVAPPNEIPAPREEKAKRPGHGRMVHDAFGVARRGARARSARLAAARFRRLQTEPKSAPAAEEIERPLASDMGATPPAPAESLFVDASLTETQAAPGASEGRTEDVGEADEHDIWVEAELQAKLTHVQSDPATIVEEVVLHVTAPLTAAPSASLSPDAATLDEDLSQGGASLPDEALREGTSTDEGIPSVVVGLPLSQPPFSFPVESPRPGPRVIRGRGRPTRAPIVTHTEPTRPEPEDHRPDEPHPIVTLAITVVAVIAVLIALALVLQRNPLAP